MIPGQPMSELGRQFHLSSSQWEDTKGPPATSPFTECQALAWAYAQDLQALCANGRTCNWVEVTFIWY